jgi:hypothetical protein
VVFFFGFQFCNVAISGDHPYEDLAKFGDEKTIGKKFIFSPTFFYFWLPYYKDHETIESLELKIIIYIYIEIWRLKYPKNTQISPFWEKHTQTHTQWWQQKLLSGSV